MNSTASESDHGELLTEIQGAPTNNRRPPIRQPLSCVPCRRSKLKCDRNLPCATCRRRKCLSACTYGPNTAKNASAGANEKTGDPDLKARVEYLEAVLRERITKPDGTARPNDILGDDPDDFQERREIALATPSHSSTHTTPDMLSDDAGTASTGFHLSDRTGFIGTLKGDDSSLDGVHYQVGQSRWDAVLDTHLSERVANTSMSDNPPAANACGINFPFDTGATADMDALLALLPPRQQCDYLISRYFALFSPLFHILHDPTFHAEYRSFTRDPRSVKLSWLSLLFVLLALAVTTLEDHDAVLSDLGREPNGADNIKALATRFRGAAMKCLAADQFLTRHRLSTVQALVLLIYAINHSEGAGKSWSLLGLTLNIAIALGCHVDGNALHLDHLETEQRRRCWAGILMLHTIQATSFGNVDILRLSSHHVQLPADVNDVDIHPATILPASSQPTQMSYLLFKFRLYRLSASICAKLFGSTPPTQPTIAGLDRAIAAEQHSWDERYLLDGGPNLLQCHNQAHWNILHGYAHQLYLLLHRPFFRLRSSDPNYYPDAKPRCLASGKVLLDIHKQFCETPYLRQYRWYTNGLGSFYALHGAVAIVACLLDGDFVDGEEARLCRVAFDEALGRFAELQGQSKICLRALPVLRYLQSLLPTQELQWTTYSSPAASSRPWIAPTEPMQMASPDEGAFGEAFGTWIQTNQWISPDSIDWSVWNSVIEQSECVQ